MKKITFILALSALPAMANPDHTGRGTVTRDGIADRAKPHLTDVLQQPRMISSDPTGSLYVFNRADSEGFLITSSDSRLRPRVRRKHLRTFYRR